MKKLLALAALVVVGILSSSPLLAQESPFVGTWKINLAKSKFAGAPAPKSETRTVVTQGNGWKLSFDGVAADGSKISWSFTTNLDGKPAPVTGSGAPSGADMLAVKRIDANTVTTSYLKAGKEVRTSRSTVSADGKVTTITAKFTDASGEPVTTVTVWDKQ
ncbi:MAG TPA: hypothetical protein VEJ46_00230 [Candidatus Acidoferrum sp.]|nr:hypothetical protein [Candidatus Acidoferrum sp.]